MIYNDGEMEECRCGVVEKRVFIALTVRTNSSDKLYWMPWCSGEAEEECWKPRRRRKQLEYIDRRQ